MANGTKSLTVNASAIDGKAQISGAGYQSLDGKDSINVSVRAENGSERVYTIKINYGNVSSSGGGGSESGVEIVEVGKGPLN